MQWLAECSVAALREALGAVAPELSGYPVTVPGPAGKEDPLWHSGSVPVGDRFFVKFAWSRPAALRLAREIGVLAALGVERWACPDGCHPGGTPRVASGKYRVRISPDDRKQAREGLNRALAARTGY